MKLYFSQGACSLSPHIVMHEAGLAFEAIPAPTKTHQLPDGTDFYTINPLGYVPYLTLDDGRSLHEGPAIVQYLADLVPEKKLAPANGTFERYTIDVECWIAGARAATAPDATPIEPLREMKPTSYDVDGTPIFVG